MRNLGPKVAKREVSMAEQGGDDELQHTSSFVLPPSLNSHNFITVHSEHISPLSWTQQSGE